MKKLTSMALALALCLAMAVPAFAAEYAPHTITKNSGAWDDH